MPDTFDFTLPSGRQITMRYPDLWELVFDDTIPDPLTGIVEGLITKTMTAYQMATQDQKKAGDEKLDKLDEHDNGVQFVQLIVERCVITPRIATTFEQARAFKADGIECLHIGQLTPADIDAIYYKSFGLGDRLAAVFRRTESTGVSLEPVSGVSEDEPAGIELIEHSDIETLEPIHG